ncbi:hypothetical protein ACMFMG_006487 [Clarireedia jacksonii]
MSRSSATDPARRRDSIDSNNSVTSVEEISKDFKDFQISGNKSRFSNSTIDSVPSVTGRRSHRRGETDSTKKASRSKTRNHANTRPRTPPNAISVDPKDFGSPETPQSVKVQRDKITVKDPERKQYERRRNDREQLIEASIQFGNDTMAKLRRNREREDRNTAEERAAIRADQEEREKEEEKKRRRKEMKEAEAQAAADAESKAAENLAKKKTSANSRKTVKVQRSIKDLAQKVSRSKITGGSKPSGD